MDFQNQEGTMVELACDGDRISFTWKITYGVTGYSLLVRNAKDRNPLVIHEKFSAGDCRYEVNMNERLRYGQVCEVKLQTYGPGEEFQESNWNVFVIGGPTVAINPTAEINIMNPRRSAIVNWDEPQEKPDYYEVVAIPNIGKARKQTCPFSPVIMKRLKSDSKYQFLVHAIHKENNNPQSTIGCKTNTVTTHSRKNTPGKFANFADIGQQSVFNFEHAQFANNSQTIKIKSQNMIKAHNTEMLMITDEIVGEQATVIWDNPDNCDESGDFEILQYNVDVREAGYMMFSMPFLENTQTHTFPINLGKCYTVNIKTTYEDIDAETTEHSYVKEIFFSRPTKPTIEVIEDKKNVHVKWSQSMGAVEHYHVHVFDEFHKQNLSIGYKQGGKNFNKTKFEIEYFLSGRYYNFEVTATGKGNRSTTNSVKQLIGGRLVPKMATAKLSATNAFAADIKWEQPDEPPIGYKITEVNDPDIVKENNQNITQCSFTGLKRGSRYCFKVMSIYADGVGGECRTNEIYTDPRPALLENVRITLDEKHPDTTICASWKRVFDALEYRIRVASSKSVLEQITNEPQIVITSLHPNTWYEISVAASNKLGYGIQDSQRIQTDLSPPECVRLYAVTWKSATVTFAQAPNNSKHSITLYQAENDIVVDNVVTDAVSYIFEELNGDTEYYASVLITERDRESIRVKSNSMKTVPNPVVINDVKLCDNNPSTDIKLEWQVEKFSSRYQIEVKVGDTIERIFEIEGVGVCTYRCLEEGRHYTFRIRVVNESGNGNWSIKKDISLGELKPPDYVVSQLDSTKPWKVFHLQWMKQHGALTYQVGIFKDGANVCWKEVEQNQWTFCDALPLTKYAISIYSKNKDCVSVEYATHVITGAPIIVDSDSITTEPDERQPWRMVRVKWERPENVENFKIKSSIGNQEFITNKECFDLVNETNERTVTISIKSGIRDVYTEEEAKITFIMDGVPKVRQDSLKIKVNENTPWETATITWEIPRGVDWMNIKIKPKRQNTWSVDKTLHNKNSLEFLRNNVENFYEFRIFTGFSKQSFHTEFTSKPFSLANFPIIKSKSIEIELDEEKPWEIANIKWEMPRFLTCVKVQIKCKALVENTIQKEVIQTDNTLRFIRTEKHHTYDIKIYSGCNGNLFQSEPTTKTFTMDSPPAVFKDTMKFEPDEEQPWKLVRLQWERPNFVETFKIFSNVTEECITENDYFDILNTTSKRGIKVKVYSGIGKVFTDVAASKKFEMDKFPIVSPEFIDIKIDQEESLSIAHIKWIMPEGLESVKVQLVSKQMDDESSIHFDEIISSNSVRISCDKEPRRYELRITPGCTSRKVFSDEHSVKTFQIGSM
ncbi:uncharacterized protein LOC120337727 isoform X2 [Styela clava]